MENGLKLRDLKRCRDTRPRASLGKAGIRLAREVGPNRFRITFTARTLYIHPVGAPCSGVRTVCLACIYSEAVCHGVHLVPRVVICLGQGGRGGVSAFNLRPTARTKSLK